MKVTLYGDSILKGVLLEDGRYTVNREWEDRARAALRITLTNRSRFGCTLPRALETIRKEAARAPEGEELALLELGGNDCDYAWEEIAADPAGAYDCKTPPLRFAALYREAIALLRRGGRVPVLLTLPPIHSERYLRFICRNGLSRENIVAWLGDVEAIARWQEKYSDMVASIAAQERVRLIDLRSAFLRDPRPAEDLLCADGIHPSRQGQRIIFQALCPQAV